MPGRPLPVPAQHLGARPVMSRGWHVTAIAAPALPSVDGWPSMAGRQFAPAWSGKLADVSELVRGDSGAGGIRRRRPGGGLPERLEQLELRRRGRSVVAMERGQRPRPSLPAGTDLLPQVKHIVVLMMENHSYDNYFGMLAAGAKGSSWTGRPAHSDEPGRGGQPVERHHMSTTEQQRTRPARAGTRASCSGTRARWTASSPARKRPRRRRRRGGHGLLDERDLPFYYGLARTFPLADRWFSSCLGPTFPNRRFLIAGTANGLVDDLPFHLLDYPPNGTIFDMLTRHGISWANYHPVAGDKSRARRLAHYRRRRARRTLIAAGPGLPRRSPRGSRRTYSSPPTCSRSALASTCCTSMAWTSSSPMPSRHAARVQPRGSRVRRVLRGEPAGHPEGGELRGRGDQPGHARQGLAGHPADLDL